MIQNGSRTIKVDKQRLINKVKENKANHEIEYEKAVEAYKKEADKQLKKAAKDLEENKLSIKINLVVPEIRSKDYDKIIDMFNWEVDELVELTQKEFNEYINDETSFAIQAKFSNSTYLD